MKGRLAINKTNPQTSPQPIDERDTLKGLQGVYVLVEYLISEQEKFGLTKQQLQTDVELRLRQSGIMVLSEQEWLLIPGEPRLYVNVNLQIYEEIGLVAFNILIELNQSVFLARDPTKFCMASTWWTALGGPIGLSKITTIRESVKDCVDIFINDYLAANLQE